jgi:sugar lactone lactonase YvrE
MLSGSAPAASPRMRRPLGSGLTQIAVLAVLGGCDSWPPPPPPPQPPSVITTIAGDRPPWAGDGGPANQARLNGPNAVTADAQGILYVSDALNQRVRKIDAAGTIATIVGNGVAGYSGDGGAAVAAQLSNPSGVAVGPTGTIYVADAGNNRIRAIDAGNRIVTVVGDGTAGFSGDGSAGGSARLNAPAGMAVDAGGSLYIADAGNNRIRKVDVSGVITTVAGSGIAGSSGDGAPAIAAQLNGPLGVAVDTAGNLYIADEGNSRIRKVDVAGVMTTVAGNGVAAFAGDGSQAALASLNHPRGVAVDRAGNIYIADTRNIRVRRVTPARVISTVAGTGGRGFAGDGGPATQALMRAPHGLAVDRLGNLLLADYGNNEVRLIEAGGIITTVAGSAIPSGSEEGGLATSVGLAHPRSVAADAGGNSYISDWNNNRVWKVNAQGVITTLAGTRIPGFSGDGGPAAQAQLNAPHGVAVDAEGNVYIADQNNHRVRRVRVVDGIIETIAGDGTLGASGDGGPAAAAKVGAPSAVAVDAAGNLYISQQVSQIVRRVSTTGLITTIAGNGTQGFSGDGGPAVQAQMRAPVGIASDSAGNLYVAEQANNRIRRVGVDGIITTIAGNGVAGFSGDGGPAVEASINGPFGVAVDRAGNVYLTDSRSDRIRWVHRDGTITTVAGNGVPGFSGDGGLPTAAQLQGPHGVAVDARGNLLIADMANDRIRRVTLPQITAASVVQP